MPEPKIGGKKLPRSFWIIGIGAAILIGLYLRNRSKSQPQQTGSSIGTGTPTDVTNNPYFYTANGAYPDTNVPYYDMYGNSPYGQQSFLANSGLPSNFDPTSFEEGISYAQQSLGLPNSVPLNSGPTNSSTGNTSTNPGLVINLDYGSNRPAPGNPKQSGRRHHHKVQDHKGKSAHTHKKVGP